MLEESLKQKILTNIKTKPDEIRYKIKDLQEDLNAGDLIINHDYQRNYLYEKETKTPSKIVESVFMGLVIPEIQLFCDDETLTNELIDGQQRVLSLVRFYQNEYALRGLECLPELNGRFFVDLPKKLQQAYKDYALNARVVRKESEHKFDLFERLNTGSKVLNKQEIRNCIYRGNVITLAKKLGDDSSVQKMLSGIQNQRQARTEMVLRLMYLLHYDGVQPFHSPSRSINHFLMSNSVKDMTESDLVQFEKRFLQTTESLLAALDTKWLIQGKVKSVPKTHLEPLFVFYSNYPDKALLKQKKSEAKKVLMALLKESEAYAAVTIPNSSLFAKQNTMARIELMKQALSPVYEG